MIDLLMWIATTVGAFLLVLVIVGLIIPLAIKTVMLKRQQHWDNAKWDDPWDLYDRGDKKEE